MTLSAFQKEHGYRLRRADAMRLLNIPSKGTFKKVIDANPEMKHRLNGEGQDKYLTSVIHRLLYATPGATGLEEAKTDGTSRSRKSA